MKKIILAAVFLSPIFLQAQAISKKISVYIQGGHASCNYLHKYHQKKLVSETETKDHKCIIFNTGLHYEISKNFKAGFSFTYDHFGTKHRSLEYSNVSFMLRLDGVWLTNNKFSCYTGVAAGITKIRKFEMEIETQKQINLAYQLYAVGCTYKILRFFNLDANIGWGVSGIFTIGGRFNF